MAIARNVAPSGLPTCRKWFAPSGCGCCVRVVFNRNSCVTAIPMLANDKDVRIQARKVRSGVEISTF